MMLQPQSLVQLQSLVTLWNSLYPGNPQLQEDLKLPAPAPLCRHTSQIRIVRAQELDAWEAVDW